MHCLTIAGTARRPVRGVRVRGLTIDANCWQPDGAWRPRAIQTSFAAGVAIEDVTLDRDASHYRTQKALAGAPATFADSRAVANLRTPHEFVWHMTGVIGYAASLYRAERLTPERCETFAAEVDLFHRPLAALGRVASIAKLTSRPRGRTTAPSPGARC